MSIGSEIPNIKQLFNRFRTRPAASRGTISEANHLWLGPEPRVGFPVLLQESLLAEHAHILGGTGSGKTTVLTSWLIQLLRGRASPKNSARDGRTRIPPMVIIDLKGDWVMLRTVFEEVQRRDPSKFRLVTIVPDRRTHYFNPFRTLNNGKREAWQICNLLCDALGLFHGDGYGLWYFSECSRQALFNAYLGKKDIGSFDELYARLKVLPEKEQRDSFQLLSTIRSLTYHTQPITSPEQEAEQPEETVRMDRVLEEGQVAYLWLPMDVGGMSVREFGKLAIYSYLLEAKHRADTINEPAQGYLFIDEWQRLAADNLSVLLQQARSSKVGCVFSNQVESDLKNRSFDLVDTMREETRVKVYCGVRDHKTAERISLMSGLEIQKLQTFTRSISNASTHLFAKHTTEAEGWTESVRPGIAVPEAFQLTQHKMDKVLMVTPGDGYTQYGGKPVVFRMSYPLRPEVYADRNRPAWPLEGAVTAEVPGTVVSEVAPQKAMADAHEELAAFQMNYLREISKEFESRGTK